MNVTQGWLLQTNCLICIELIHHVVVDDDMVYPSVGTGSVLRGIDGPPTVSLWCGFLLNSWMVMRIPHRMLFILL
jgi:hypothetical protein